jgi:hypothetical protein
MAPLVCDSQDVWFRKSLETQPKEPVTRLEAPGPVPGGAGLQNGAGPPISNVFSKHTPPRRENDREE